MTPSTHADGQGGMATDLPNPREISNMVSQEGNIAPNALGASDMLWAWGQFIDHDLDLTEAGNSEPAMIPVPDDDPVFAPGGMIQFTRVEAETAADGTRYYHNEITAYLDASMVYGSDAETAAMLRDGAHLRLEGGALIRTEDGVLAGDVRAAENVALTSLHTLFAREHNRLVDLQAEAHPNWSDTRLFTEARARVEAKIQAITYTEFLPLLVGEDAIARYDGFDAEVNPGITMAFSTAAYRFGHSLLSSEIIRIKEDGAEIAGGPLSLRDAFFNPDAIAEGGGIAPILRGLATGQAQAVDTKVTEEVRSFLFAPTGETGLDLAAINIQRGRDMGMGSYNDLRVALGMDPAKDFADITGDADLAADLAALYATVDRVDAWVGGLAEDAAGDGLLGETFAHVIVDQFTRLRDGDAMWSQSGVFTPAETERLWDTTLADVIKANSTVGMIQDTAFLAFTRQVGTARADEITGSAGRDLILGNRRGDLLQGGAGDDQIHGGRGRDTLIGGLGDDTLYGGIGADTFILMDNGSDDVIAGWDPRDRLVLGPMTTLAEIRETGPDVVLVLGQGSTVTLLDADPDQIAMPEIA